MGYLKRVTVLCIAAVCAATSIMATSATRPATTFVRIDTSEGLPAQAVWAITQDHDGFMWIGTSSGLVRYDGVTMQVFDAAPDSGHGLVSDAIGALHVDRTGRLWVGTEGGLCSLEGRQSFVCLTDDAGVSKSVSDLAELQDGTILAAGFGLHRVDPGTGRVEPVQAISSGYWLSVLVDSQQRIWVGGHDDGLRMSEDGGESFQQIMLGDSVHTEGEGRNRIRDVFEDSQGRIWVATDDGVIRLQADGRLDTDFFNHRDLPVGSGGLNDVFTNTILEGPRGDIWIGTWDGGLNRVHIADETVSYYRADPSDPKGPGMNRVVTSYVDRTGVLWFGGTGVVRLDPASEDIWIHEPDRDDSVHELITLPTHMMIDQEDTLFLGSRSGLARYRPDEEAWQALLENQPVVSLAGSPFSGFRYVGVGKGILLHHVRRYEATGEAFGPSHVSIDGWPFSILETQEQGMWAGTNAGLLKFGGGGEPDQILLFHDPQDPSTITSGHVHVLEADPGRGIWVGTDQGLSLINPETLKVKRVLESEITALALDEGKLWVGTSAGLLRLDPETGETSLVSKRSGLPGNRVEAILVGDSGEVWVGSERGLARYDPESGLVRVFDRAAGLPHDRIVALARSSSDRIFVATYGGLASLDPGRYQQKQDAPVPIVVSVSTSGPDGLEYPGSGPLHLSSEDRVVTLSAALMDFRNQSRSRHRYQLEGIDESWMTTDAVQLKATYTTLPIGSHTFRFQSMDTDGTWREGIPLEFQVAPPLWLSPAALIGYLVLLVIAIVLLVRYRTASLRTRAGVLEAAVQDRTAELAERTQQVLAQGAELKELVASKDKLYANVSHEFRTPLTVILGPVERMLADEASAERRGRLEVIRRNAQRLLRLVDQLMVVSRLDAGRVVKAEAVNFPHLVTLALSSIQSLADQKDLKLIADVDRGAWVSGEEEALEQVVYNLLSNALKYTPHGGSIAVTVAQVSDERVELKVQDDGIGISNKHQDAVFDRFFRVEDQGDEAQGTGIGLALTRDLINAMGGEISLSSESGQGTEIKVELVATEPQNNAPDIEMDNWVAVEGPAPDSRFTDTERLPSALIVEDNHDLCQHIADVLKGQADCAFAHDGTSGVRQALELIPDIVICDVMLPGVNGFEVTRQIKEDDRTSHIPLIMLTARADEASRLSGLRALADVYLTKPFNGAELRQHVDTLLTVRELLRQRFSKADRTHGEPLTDTLSNRDQRFMDRLDDVLQTHYVDLEFSVGDFANQMAMSERQLQRKLKALTNMSPKEYLRNFRLHKALPMLEQGDPVGTVADATGFSSQSYFAACFRAAFGSTPSQYAHTAEIEVERE